jgi:DNA polymerase/3'-5' exonuclease PolX
MKRIAEGIAEIDALVGTTRDTSAEALQRKRRSIAEATCVPGRITHVEGSNPLSMMVATDHGFQVAIRLVPDEARRLADLLKMSAGRPG